MTVLSKFAQVSSCNERSYTNLCLIVLQLEFKSASGSVERGRTLMDSILESYPKRSDIWNVYCDMELKALSQTSADNKQARTMAVDTTR